MATQNQLTSFFSILLPIFWISLKLLSLNLWLAAAITFTCSVLLLLLVYILQARRENSDFNGPAQQQIGTAFFFSFSTLWFSHKERSEKTWSRWSRLVLIVSFLAVLIELSGFDGFDPFVNNGIYESVKSKLIKAGEAAKKS